MPRRGLPETVRMRHDEHYVEALAASAGAPIGRLIPIDRIDPNPNQPRQVMGDLSELMASVAEKGVIEPLIVRSARRPFPDHRRRAPLSGGRSGRASRAAGRHSRRRRRRGDRAGAGREHPAQGPDARSKRPRRCSTSPRRARIRTRRWPGSSASRARRSPSRSR